MKKIITKNITLKIVSFFIAFFLWAYVIFSENPLVTRECKVPIETINLDSNEYYLANKLPSVKITYRTTRRKVLLNEIEENIHPQVNLLSLVEGDYDLKIFANVPPDTELRSIKPSHVKVTLKKLIKKSLPVQPKNFRISLARGLYSSSLKFYPRDVRITGKEKNISKVSGIIILDEVKDAGNYKKNLPVFIVDKDSKQVKNLSVDPPFLKVIYTVKELPQKNVPIIADLTNKLPKNLLLKETIIDPNTVNIRAKPDVLKDIKTLKTEPIDLSKIDNSLKQWKYISLKNPSVIINPDRVEVTLKISQKELKKRIKIHFSSDEAGFIADPATVEVELGYFNPKSPENNYEIRLSKEKNDPMESIKELLNKNGFIFYSSTPKKIKLKKENK